MPKYSLRTLLFLTAVAAIVVMIWMIPSQRAANHVRRARTTTEITSVDEKSIGATTKEYSIGNYGVIEFGKTRIAVLGYTFPGASGSGGLQLKSDHGGWSSSGSAGKLSTSFVGVQGGTRCQFGSVNFDIIDGWLSVGGKKFDVINKAESIILDTNGEVLSVHEIPD